MQNAFQKPFRNAVQTTFENTVQTTFRSAAPKLSNASKIAIVGGGIAGLTSAYYLQKKYPGCSCTVFEKSNRLGGWIQTVDGIEKGPRTLRPTESVLELLIEIGLKDHILYSQKEAQKRFVWDRGELHAFSPFNADFAKALMRDLFAKKAGEHDETVSSFFSRRYGLEFTEKWIDPFCRGIFATSPMHLSMAACMPKIWKAAQKGSLVRSFFSKKKKGPKGLITLYSGLELLIQVLGRNVDVRYQTEFKLEQSSQYDAVIWTAPPPNPLLGTIPNGSLKLYHLLFYSMPDIPKGFGYLTSSRSQEKLLGAVFDGFIFPHAQPVITLFYPEGARIDDAIERHLGTQLIPHTVLETEAKHCIPQYPVDHLLRLEAFKHTLPPNVFVTGSHYNGVGVGDCIHSAKELVMGM